MFYFAVQRRGGEGARDRYSNQQIRGRDALTCHAPKGLLLLLVAVEISVNKENQEKRFRGLCYFFPLTYIYDFMTNFNRLRSEENYGKIRLRRVQYYMWTSRTI